MFVGVKKYPLLSAEEEQELTLEYFKTRNENIKNKLINSNLRLVIKLANHISKNNNVTDDLIQEGCLGLIRAVEKFDPYKQYKLATYAGWWIRAYMFKYLMHKAPLMKICTTVAKRKLFFSLSKEMAKLSAKGLGANVDEVAKKLDVTPDDVLDILYQKHQAVSLETTIYENDCAAKTLGDIIPSNDPSVSNIVEENNLKENIKKVFNNFSQSLTPNYKEVFERRFATDNPETLENIGKDLGLRRQRIQQIDAAIKRNLKRALLSNNIGP